MFFISKQPEKCGAHSQTIEISIGMSYFIIKGIKGWGREGEEARKFNEEERRQGSAETNCNIVSK